MVMSDGGPGAAGIDDAPRGFEWGCEECDYHTRVGAEAGAHSDEHRHGLALRPLRLPPRLVDEDLQRVVTLALDLAYYRSVVDDGGLGLAAWFELRDAVRALPEAQP